MIAALGFDFYRAVGQQLKLKKWGIMLGDGIFWTLLTPVIFAGLLWGNRGEMRAYVLVGLALGVIIYRKFISMKCMPMIKWIVFSFKWIVTSILRINKFFWRILTCPFRLIARVFSWPIKKWRENKKKE